MHPKVVRSTALRTAGPRKVQPLQASLAQPSLRGPVDVRAQGPGITLQDAKNAFALRLQQLGQPDALKAPQLQYATRPRHDIPERAVGDHRHGSRAGIERADEGKSLIL